MENTTDLIDSTNFALDAALFNYCAAVAADNEKAIEAADTIAASAAAANNAAHGDDDFNDGYIADAARAASRVRNLNAEVARCRAKLAEAEAELAALKNFDRAGMTPGERLGFGAAFADDFSVIRYAV